MRHMLISPLLVATLLPIVSPWRIIAYYQVNKDYIAHVLCENRAKPELYCDGKARILALGGYSQKSKLWFVIQKTAI